MIKHLVTGMSLAAISLLPFSAYAEVPSEFVSEYVYVERTKSAQGFEWSIAPTVIVDNLEGFEEQPKPAVSQYGGFLDTQY